MKDKESKRFSFAHICAYLSLVISVTMIVLWCCNAGGFKVVSLDSFVGVIVALLAIVVTLVVGWQIYNALELKAKIEELNNLKEKLNIQEKKIAEQSNYANHLIFAALADVELYNKQYLKTFSYSMISLEETLLLDNPKNVEAILERLEISISNMQQGILYNDMKNFHEYDNKIRNTRQYNMIKNRYEKIYNDFISKVKDDKNE